MMFAGVSGFWKLNLTFIDHGVKINDTYYHDVLLTKQLLPVMREISGEFFYLPARQCSSTPTLRDN